MSQPTEKAGDRRALLLDAEYFSTELSRRVQQLAEIEKDGRVFSDWQQSGALVRRVRGVLRRERDLDARRARLEREAA